MQYAFDFGEREDIGAACGPRAAGPAKRSSDTYFFALRPDGEVLGRIVDETMPWIASNVGVVEAATKPANLHVSVLGVAQSASYPAGLIASVCERTARLHCAPFVIRFDRLMSFRGRRRKTALVLTTRHPPPALCDLRNDLRERLAGIGVGAPRGFTPHMTLGYSETRIAETPVSPVAWRATAICLIHSFHGQARHDVLATIPLDG